jgi:hypothetical protein
MTEQHQSLRSTQDLKSGLPLSADSESYILRRKKTIAVYDAYGGSPHPFRGPSEAEDGGPTKAGQYVVVGTWKHSRASSTWIFSRIEWGTPVRDDGSKIWIQINGQWKDQEKITGCTRAVVLEEVRDLYERSIHTPPQHPLSSWILNDFGHISGFIAEDLNRNLHWDRDSENIHPQFFHTTPDNELQSLKGLPVILEESHGCIHVKPKDIDEMIQKGYLAKGNAVYIHAYDIKPLSTPTIEPGKAPYSICFYPGIKKIHIQGY